MPRQCRYPSDPALRAPKPELGGRSNVARIVERACLDRHPSRGRREDRHDRGAAIPAKAALHRRSAVSDIPIATQCPGNGHIGGINDQVNRKRGTTGALAMGAMADHGGYRGVRQRISDGSAQAASIPQTRPFRLFRPRARGQRTDSPPSIVSSAPVMNAASSDERKAMPPTISSATAHRPSGNFCSISFFAVSTSGNRPA